MTGAARTEIPIRPMRPVDADTAPFWDLVDQGVLAFQRCAACRRLRFYPQARCPHCGSPEHSWDPVSGAGRVRTWSVQYNAGDPWFREHLPYVIAVVELEDDSRLRMLANIVGCDPATVHFDQRVTVVFEPVDEDRRMYAFKPT
ncbi:MAG TPA: Zn-ribbon domain-containing OB-fold protein [Mycobacteriales bacterium]|jgi:uncharacterized OB-fold protein|nr:Zn-ribbon domain-containing OB-fold protein [Mycobacteriales bacterium]